MLDRVARHAPDLRDKVRAIDVLTPDDLRRRNPNAVRGDPYGGCAELDQSLLWRPLATSGRHATPVGRLWHIGASTHPGAGLGGGSGHLVATTLVRRSACDVDDDTNRRSRTNDSKKVLLQSIRYEAGNQS